MHEGNPAPADGDTSAGNTEAMSRFLMLAVIEGMMLGTGVLALVAEKTSIGIALIVGGLLIGMMGVGTLVAAKIKARQAQHESPPDHADS